jgi:hypothetical protein
MNITILTIAIPILFLLLVLPLFLRFVIGRIILVLVKKKYINAGVRESLSGKYDRDALEKVEQILYKKLSSPFLQAYDFKNEIVSIILTVQNCYVDVKQDKLEFTFSVSDLIKCYFLLMSDINQILNDSFWLKSLRRSKISTLKRISRISGYYNLLYNRIPFLKVLRKGRITGKIVRILLIPILGLPSIFISIFLSIISIFLTEILWKYYYSVALIKCAYYSILLYGDKDSLIKHKIIQFPNEKIKKLALKVEDLINPENIQYRSDSFEDAYVEFQKSLELFGISPEKNISFEGVHYRFNKKRNMVKRVMNIPINAAKQYNPFYKKTFSEKDQLLQLIHSISRVYTPKEEFYEEFRVLHVFEISYMISVLAYYKLLFSSKLLDNLTVDFLLKAKNFNDEIFNEILSNKLPVYKQIYKSFRLVRKSRLLYKAVRAANPVSFLVSFSGPLAFESVKSQMKDYIYQRVGRFTLYSFESDKLKRNKAFFIPD